MNGNEKHALLSSLVRRLQRALSDGVGKERVFAEVTRDILSSAEFSGLDIKRILLQAYTFGGGEMLLSCLHTAILVHRRLDYSLEKDTDWLSALDEKSRLEVVAFLRESIDSELQEGDTISRQQNLL